MRAIQVTCPKCGAALRVGDGSDEVTCEYCGAIAQVQRRSRVLDRVMPMPAAIRAAIAANHRPIAVQRRSRVGLVIFLVSALLVTVFLVLVVRSISAQLEREEARKAAGGGAPSQARGPNMTWLGHGGALVVDVDGDGDLDVIGRIRATGTEDWIAVIALDGATGKKLWSTEPLGTYTDTYQGNVWLAGDAVLFTTSRAGLSAFEVSTGKPRWTTTLPERVRRFCAGGDGTVIAAGTDEVDRPLRLADGKAAAESPQAAAATPCAALPHDGDDGNPVSGRTEASSELTERHGVWSASVMTSPGGARILVGQRSKGTHTGLLVGLDEHDAARWTVTIAPDPLAASESAPALVAIDGEVVCASYQPSASQARPRLSCFELTSGARRWDVALGADHPLEAMLMAPGAVLVSMWGLLEAHDTKTGKIRWRHGS